MDVINGVVKTFARGAPADLIIKDLSSNSRHLLELDGLLRVKLGKIDIYSFYELLPLSPLKSPVVERHSALLNVPSEVEQIGLDADHRAMCRPVDRNDFIYETIAQRIMSIMNRQLDKTQYSKDLTDMTNALASRQIEHISNLTQNLHESATGVDVPPILATFIQQTLNFHMGDQAALQHEHGLEEILKSLPTHKMKGFVESVQSIMMRASSVTDLLLLVERQNDQRKVEERMALERQANEIRIKELIDENVRLKEALRRRGPRSPSPRGRNRNRQNWTWTHEDDMTKTRYRTTLSSSQRLSCSRSRAHFRIGAEISSEGSRKNDLLEVLNHHSSSPVDHSNHEDVLKHDGQGGLELHKTPPFYFDDVTFAAPGTEAMTELHQLSSGPEPSVFEDVDSSVQPPQKPVIPTGIVSGGLMYHNRSNQQIDSLRGQTLNAGFDASPAHCDWIKSPLFAETEEASEWPILFPEETTATTVSEARTPWNNGLKQGSDLERQVSGTLLDAPSKDAAFHDASLDTGEDDVIVKDDVEWWNGKLVNDSATNNHSAASHVGPEAASSLALTDTQTNHFGLSSYSDPIVQDTSCDAAAAHSEQLERNKIKLDSSEECFAASCEQSPNIELDCAVDAARSSRRSPLGIPFRLVQIVFVALRPPAVIIDACKPASLARSTSAMIARLSTSRPDKKTAKNRDETERRVEKAISDVSEPENALSSPDEQMGSTNHLKRVGMKTTAADIRLAAKLQPITRKKDEEEQEAKTVKDASGRDDMSFLSDHVAKNPYSIPTVASIPPSTGLQDKSKVSSASIRTDAKACTPGPRYSDNSDFVIFRALDRGESNRRLLFTDDEISNGYQSLMLNYTAQVAQNLSSAYPRGAVATQELRKSYSPMPFDDQGEADDVQREKIISSRIQMQGLVQKLTGLLEVGQQVMTASQGDKQVQ